MLLHFLLLFLFFLGLRLGVPDKPDVLMEGHSDRVGGEVEYEGGKFDDLVLDACPLVASKSSTGRCARAWGSVIVGLKNICRACAMEEESEMS